MKKNGTDKINKKGISLISLIITVIVIIILAAIVIFTGLNTPDSAQFANFTQQVDNVQMAVTNKFADLKTKHSIEGHYRTDEQIYLEIATGKDYQMDKYMGTTENNIKSSIEESTGIQNITVEGAKNKDHSIAMTLPKVRESNTAWYVTKEGRVFNANGYTYNNKTYFTGGIYQDGTLPAQDTMQEGNADKIYEAIKNGTNIVIDATGTGGTAGENAGNSESDSGGNEEPAEETISKNDSFVDYFADVDGNGSIDGIIYVDLLAQAGTSGTGLGFSYTIPSTVTTANVKDYVLSQTGVVDSRFGTTARDVIKPAISSSGTQERFYVMGLDNLADGATEELYWYNGAYGNMPSTPETSTDFGTGRANTQTLLAKYKPVSEGGYGNTNTRDMWNYVDSGWFIPSKAELAVFAKKYISSYSSCGLSNHYWTSSQNNANTAWYAHFSMIDMYSSDVNDTRYVRLSTTF